MDGPGEDQRAGWRALAEQCRWQLPDLTRHAWLSDLDDEDLLGDLVASGADLSPATIVHAYSIGLFPMPDPRSGGLARRRRDPLWWSPVRRGVLPLRALRVSRSLRRSTRRLEVRLDTAFDDVVRACAAPNRAGGWIDRDILTGYSELHRLGVAHSVEAWSGDDLVGGLYGVSLGGLFAGESMFHRVPDASKVALVGLVELLSDDHVDERVLDTQWVTPHLASLGVIEVARSSYLLDLLPRALELPEPAWP